MMNDRGSSPAALRSCRDRRLARQDHPALTDGRAEGGGRASGRARA
jgi:hypothetical protein